MPSVRQREARRGGTTPTLRRLFLSAMLLAFALFSGFADARPRLAVLEAAGAGGGGADIVVAKDGSGDYTSIKDALGAAKSGTASRYFVILVKAGVYNEQAVLPASLRFIGLVGEKGAKISASNYAGQSNLNDCSTFQLLASDVVVSNIIFENAHGPGEQGGDQDQAVAVKVSGTRVAFYGCSFLGYQDTLYALSGLQYYKNCVIQGRVDFVFGDAKALFHNCQFHLVYWGGGYFAQSRQKGEDTGFVVLGGSLSPLGKGPIKPGYLARSWGKYSTTIFINTFFAAGSVRAEGWGYVGGNKRMHHVTFAAYGCYGPGYNTTGWDDNAVILTAAEAAPYSSISYVNQGGWIADPNTLVRGVGGKVNNGGGGGNGAKGVAGKGPAQNATPVAPTPPPQPAASGAGNSKKNKRQRHKQNNN